MVIFFLRKHPDVEHISPVIYKMATQKNDGIKVLCIDSSYNIWSHPVIKKICELKGVEVDYAVRYHAPTVFHRLISYFIFDPPDNPTLTPSQAKIIAGLFSKVLKRLFQFTTSRLGIFPVLKN